VNPHMLPWRAELRLGWSQLRSCSLTSRKFWNLGGGWKVGGHPTAAAELGLVKCTSHLEPGALQGCLYPWSPTTRHTLQILTNQQGSGWV
jgi:hypothetical protein